MTRALATRQVSNKADVHIPAVLFCVHTAPVGPSARPFPTHPPPRRVLRTLHWTLLRSLPIPLVGSFATLMFLLLMQFLIRHLPDLVGRGLPLGVLVELVAYSLAYMVTLAVPMSVLIATLAAFGKLAESRAYPVAITKPKMSTGHATCSSEMPDRKSVV